MGEPQAYVEQHSTHKLQAHQEERAFEGKYEYDIEI